MSQKGYTLLGLITVIIWGTSAAFTRTLSTSLGSFTAAALVNIISGLLALGKQVVFDGKAPCLKDASKTYWFVCGGLFVLYTALSYISMEAAGSEEEAVTLVLIRFMWPLFTLLLTIPILKQKASPWLIASAAISMLGVAAAKLGDDIFHLDRFMASVTRDFWPYFLSLVVALSWAFYTNYTKKLLTKEVGSVGIFMLLSGLLLGMVAIFREEPRIFSFRTTMELLYQAIAVALIANLFWNKAILKGNLLIVILASNFLPIISTVIAGMILGVRLNRYVLIGSVLVVIGTIWSRHCFAPEKQLEKECT